VLLLQDLVDAGYEPLAYRYWFLQAHYRQQQSFTDEAMASAAKGYRRLLGHAAELRGVAGQGDPERQEPLRARFRAAMHDDLNAPQAMAVAWEVARSSELPDPDKRDLLLHFDRTLALDLASAAPEADAESDPRIDALVAEREAARKGKDFAAADRIRDELAAEGIVVKDTPQGSTWKRA